jgi:DNA polymerase
MSSEISEELLAISRELREQLRFYREVGVEDIGGSAFPVQSAPGADSTAPASPSLIAAASVADARMRSETQVEQVGLFGDIILQGQTGSRSRSTSMPALEFNDSSLNDIREDIGDCRRCKLCEHRRTIVFGEGNPHARLVFVGEGPGAEEDATGRPFVGRAGQLLDKIIEAIGLKREEVYIANIVKCRPPGNRAPERDEVETCEPFLFRQLACIRPQVIVALGSPAFQCLLRTREPITRARGVWREWNGIKIMPTFHPAFLLRSPDKKREVWEDMKKVREELKTEK